MHKKNTDQSGFLEASLVRQADGKLKNSLQIFFCFFSDHLNNLLPLSDLTLVDLGPNTFQTRIKMNKLATVNWKIAGKTAALTVRKHYYNQRFNRTRTSSLEVYDDVL